MNPEQKKTIEQLRNTPIENWTEEEKSSGVTLVKTMIKIKDFYQKVLPKQMNEASSLLLQHYGWHIRMNMAFDNLIPYMNAGDEEVNTYMMKRIYSSIRAIKRTAIERFPERAKAIKLAFRSHRRGEYELSIPAFLILSEGIFREMTHADIFSKTSKSKKEFIEKLKEDAEIISILPYTIEAVINGDIIGLNFSKEDHLKFPNVLHRNLIIHGASIEYGTKVNSYKAISQFEFVITFVYLAFSKGKISDSTL